MAEVVGYASLAVIPVLQGIQGNLQQMMRPLLQQSQQIGVTVGNNIAQGAQNAEGKVRQASQRMQAARAAEADAAGRARIAEAQLNEVRARGDAATSDLIQAEERLRIAQREAADATKQRERAVDQLSRAQADLANSTDDVADSTDEAEQSTSRFRDSIGGLGGHLSDGAKKLGAFAVAAAGIGGAMEIAAGAVENQQITNKLAAQMGATGPLAAEYGQKAGDLYRNGFGESMQDAADAVGMVSNSFRTAGFEGEKSMEDIAASAMNFSTIFDQDVGAAIQTASQLVTNGLAKDSTEAFDLLTASFQRVPAAMREELPEIIQEYGTNFRALGFSGEEAFSLLVSASEQGKFALDKTGDALKEFTIRGSDMSTASVDAYQAIGLNAEEMSKKIAAGGDGAQEAMRATAEGLLKIEDPATRANTAIALFGTPLEDLSIDQIPAFLQGLTGAEDNMAGFAGASEEAGNTLNSGIGVALETLKRKVVGGLTDALGVAAQGVLTGAAGIHTALSPAIDTVKLFIGAFTGAGSDVQLPWMNTVIDLASRARGVFDEVKGGFTALVAAFKDGGNEVTSSGFAGFLEQLGLWFRMAWDTGSQFVGLLQSTLVPVVMNLGQAALPVLGVAFDALVSAISTIVNIGTKIVNFFIENKDVTAALAAVITAFMLPALVSLGVSLTVQAAQWTLATVQMIAYNVAGKAIATATKAWAAAQWVLNAALTANPIGLIIAGVVALGAGLVLAWQRSETFRNVVMGAWEGIKSVVSGAWTNVLKPTIDWIVGAFGWIGEKAQWLWTSVIQPVFGFIGQAARILMAVVGTVLITPFILAWNMLSAVISTVWTNVISPIWEVMKFGLNLLGSMFSWVWNAVIKPAWDGLGAGIAWVYNTVIAPTWDALKGALAAVGGFFQMIWNDVIRPAWDALGAGINWVWANVISPAWDALKGALGAVGGFFQWVWNDVIKPAWDGLGNGIKWVWENVISPVWESLKSGLDTVKSSFETAVGFIGQVWDRIKGIVAAPVKFVVETVYNNGIRPAWNKVAGFLGLSELAPVELGNLAAYATGGHVRGAGGPTDDKIPALLSNGEYVVRAAAVKEIGVGNLDRINQNPVSFTKGGAPSGEGMFVGNEPVKLAGGGSVDEAIDRVFRFMRGEHGKPYQYGGVGDPSWDCSGLWSGIVHELNGRPARSGRQFSTESDFESMGWVPGLNGRVTIGIMRGGGGPNSHMAGTIDGTNMESAGDTGVQLGGAARGSDASMFGLQYTLPDIGGEFVSGGNGGGGGAGFFRRMIAGLFDGIMNPIGGMIPSFGDSEIGKLPKLAFDKFRTSVRDWILGQADQRGGGSSGGSFDVAPGSGPAMDQVREAFAAYGWNEGAQWDAAQWIIGKESSWNPTARNSSSGAYGLFQFLGSTKDQYLPDENPNPKVQGDAGARYIRDRYGDPLAAKAFWEQNGWYDQGGLASGVGVMLKNVVQPERVLSPEMTEHFERLVDVLERPDFIDALMKSTPAADVPAELPGGSGSTPAAPVGGTGVDSTYTSEENTDWGKRASDIGVNFAQANADQFKSDLGLPSGDGFVSQLVKGGVKVVEEHVHYHVTNIDEAMRKERERRTKDALTFSRRG